MREEGKKKKKEKGREVRDRKVEKREEGKRIEVVVERSGEE